MKKPKEETITTTKEEEEREKYFTDDADIVRGIIEVYKEKREEGDVDINFILAQLDDKERTYIRKQYLTARKIQNFIADKEEANKIFNLIIAELRILCIVNRNKKGNLMVEGILRRGTQGEPLNVSDPEKKGIVNKFLSFFSKKKKRPNEE